jgi:hypothetical protein
MRVYTVLTDPDCGLALVAATEFQRASNTRANEYEKNGVFNRYISFIQDLCMVPVFLEGLNRLSAEDRFVQFVKNHLVGSVDKMKEKDVHGIRETVVEIENSGVPAVDGTYRFISFKNNAG